MALEIERKFLLKDESWRKETEKAKDKRYCRQGYMSFEKLCTVRVRVMDSEAWLTVKGANTGISRLEYDYMIPVDDANAMLEEMAQKPIIEKTRYKIPYGGFIWEIDEFYGENLGLVIAEIELGHPDEPFMKPDWIGEEVSDDPRYYNANLVKNPYYMWKV